MWSRYGGSNPYGCRLDGLTKTSDDDHTCWMISLKPQMILTEIIERSFNLLKHLKINQDPNSLNILLIYSELINSNFNVSEMHT